MSGGVAEPGRSVVQPLSPATVTVPASPEGVATALSVLSAGMTTTGPERSHPSYRMHPPLIEVDRETQSVSGNRTQSVTIPPRVSEHVPDTEIEIQVPPNYAELFVIGPLAYYLGASVQTVPGREKPQLNAPGITESFSALPALQTEVADLLQTVFFLDCLTRDVQEEEPPYQRTVLDTIGLTPAEIQSLSPADRLRTYLSVDRSEIEQKRPTWHLSTYVEPHPEMVEGLPFLLDDMSLIYLPEADEIDESKLLQRALDDFFRGPVNAVDMVDPELQPGEIHAWLGNGVPVQAYTPSIAAYRNRLSVARPETPLDVAVVLNDEAMDGEYDAVTRFYRSSDLPVGVSVHNDMSVAELSRLFESSWDFVHYIGHCEVGGLQCPDGELDIGSLARVGVRTFFLNACGSYEQGKALVDRGSVAGAATLRTVLNEPAVEVGETFARLFVSGFGIEHAMQLARRQIMMSTDYTVIGDGTYSLTDEDAALARLTEKGATYTLSYTPSPGRRPGEVYLPPFEPWHRLSGTSATVTVSSGDVPQLLGEISCPVIFDGELRWADDLADDFLSDHS